LPLPKALSAEAAFLKTTNAYWQFADWLSGQLVPILVCGKTIEVLPSLAYPAEPILPNGH